MKKTERNNDILSLIKSGISYAEIGRRYNVTKQRIYQLAKANNIHFRKGSPQVFSLWEEFSAL